MKIHSHFMDEKLVCRLACILRTYVETQSPLHIEHKQSTFFLPEYIADTIKSKNRFAMI